jgi:Domain of unknown function (DUF1864)
MKQQVTADKLSRVTTFVRLQLPDANVACRDGALTLPTWVRLVHPVIADTQSVVDELGRAERLGFLQHLSLILASGERLAQGHGHAPGWIVQQLPGLAEALVAASAGERVPALTAELYWERNTTHPPLSFTGEPHESFFISAVRTQIALRAMVNQQLRVLVDGDWNPATPEGARMLRAAAAAMEEAHGQYLDFRHGPDGAPLMTPLQFNEMRMWLAPTVIAGQTLAGANAAYIPEMVVTDFLLGTASADYDEYVRSFDQYESPEGRALIARDRNRTSLITILARSLGFSGEEFDQASATQVADRVRSAPTAFSWTLTAFKHLIGEFIGSSGAHVGLVHAYLEKYAADLSPEQLAAMPVKPTQGTGGHSHGHTREIHDMRRQATPFRKFITALKEAA